MVKKVKKKAAARSAPAGSPAEKLRAMQQGWSDTEARTGGAQFPPGRDQEGFIKEVVIETSKKGALQVHWTIEGTSDGIEGMTDHKWSSMGTPENRQWLRGEMETIDLAWPDTPEQLGESLGPAVGLGIRFDVVNKKSEEYENHNIYYREALEGSNAPAASGTDPTYTKATITALGIAEDEVGLQLIIDVEALNIDPDSYDTWPEVATAIITDLAL